MGSSTTAKRRAKQQPQSSNEKKKLLGTERHTNQHEKQHATKTSTGRTPTQQLPRQRRTPGVAAKMEGSSVGTVTVGFVIMLLIAILIAARNILGGDNGGVVSPGLPPPPPTSAPAPMDDSSSSSSYTNMGTYQLLQTIPHDTGAFTQGLVTIQDRDGNIRLYEGTGMYGDSELRILDLNGTVLERHLLPSDYFGEGIVHFPLLQVDGGGDDAYGLLQLTWRESTMFEYRLPLDTVGLSPPIANTSFTSTNSNEGWGITYDPLEQVFYMTDGSAFVHVWDRASRSEIRKIPVTYQFPRHSAPIRLTYLNELEWDPTTQTILANVLGQDMIVRIDPTTGFVATIYDFGPLFPVSERPRGTDVFNGIALSYDLHRSANANRDQQQYWVTGKYWPSMYYVKLIDNST